MTLTEFEQGTLDNFALDRNPLNPFSRLILYFKDGSTFKVDVPHETANQFVMNVKSA